MRAFEPSRTAMAVALQRAAHQTIDEPKVFDDALAVRIIGEKNQSVLRAFIDQSDNDPVIASSRAFLVARSRYTEDRIADAIRRGVKQCLILGAGLDTFGYRCQAPGVKIIEVDHPATQSWKRNLLQEAGIVVPESLSFIPVDFSRTTIETALTKTSWSADRPLFVSWLGVASYLTRDTVMNMLRFVSSLTSGSEIVFDYVTSPSLWTEAQQQWFEWLNPRIDATGEPLQTFFDPTDLIDHLTKMGFVAIDDVAPEALNTRYFAGRKDNLKTITTLSHLLHARLR